MRIAVSGTHRTGKSTLVQDLVDCLPGFEAIDEPYLLLEEEGQAFATIPDLDAFEQQLTRSIQAVRESGPDTVFDRCPLDVLAYLLVHEDAARLDAARWLPDLRDAMARLDLLVLVPVEEPDRFAAGGDDDGDLRQRVAEQLREIVLDDAWGFGASAVEVGGTPEERVAQVLALVKQTGGASSGGSGA